MSPHDEGNDRYSEANNFYPVHTLGVVWTSIILLWVVSKDSFNKCIVSD